MLQYPDSGSWPQAWTRTDNTISRRLLFLCSDPSLELSPWQPSPAGFCNIFGRFLIIYEDWSNIDHLRLDVITVTLIESIFRCTSNLRPMYVRGCCLLMWKSARDADSLSTAVYYFTFSSHVYNIHEHVAYRPGYRGDNGTTLYPYHHLEIYLNVIGSIHFLWHLLLWDEEQSTPIATCLPKVSVKPVGYEKHGMFL